MHSHSVIGTVGTSDALADDHISQLLNHLAAKAKVAAAEQQQQDIEDEEQRPQRHRRAASSSDSPPPSPRAGGDNNDNNDCSYQGSSESPSRYERSRPTLLISQGVVGSNEKRTSTTLDKVDSIMEKGDSIVSNLLRTRSTIQEVLHTGNTIVRLHIMGTPSVFVCDRVTPLTCVRMVVR